MMKCFALCTLLVTLSMCPHALAYLGDDMAKTIQGCCDDGYEYASSRDASACQGSLEAQPDVPPVLLSMCTMAKAQCCREYFQKKSQCESGVEVFARTSSCDSARDIGQSCCSECSKGTASGAAQGHSGCERSPSGSSADDTLAHGAFVKCCEESAKEWQASFARSEANDISSSKLPSTCDAYAPNELCAHHCVPVPGSYRCECNPGYVLMADGRNCKELQEPAKEWKDSSGHKEANDITLSKLPSTCEEYAPNELCAHHCIPVPGSYRCECNPGFMLMADGRNCKEVTKNRCKPRNHCQHKCNDNGLEVKCSCRRGYELMSDGKSCQDIDECQLDVLVCLAGTTCVNLQGSYRCVPNKRESSLQCPAGFTRNAHNDACDDVNECLLTTPPCPVYICENTIGGYSCGGVPGNPEHLGSSTPAAEEDRCPPGFKIGLSGECEDVDECMTGKHDCNPLSQFCINTHSSFHCQDKVSRHCPPGFKIDVNTNKCADINECEEDPGVCRPDQLCVNQLGQYDCKPRQDSSSGGSSCPNGMRKKVGSLYCEDIDECAEGLHMCDLLQNCLNTNGSYDCHCKLGYELDVTSGACVDVNECATGEHECIPQRQRCDNTVGSYLCVRIAPCGTGYVLQHSTGQCEDIDECALGTHNCGPEHTCFNIRGSFRCVRRRTTTSSTTPPPEYEYEYYDSDEETDNNTSTGNETPKDTSTSSTSTTPRPEPPTSRQTPTPQHGPTLNRRSEDNYIEPTSGDVYYSEPNNTDTSHPLLVIPKLPELPPKPEVPGPQPTEQQPRPTEPSRPTVTPPRPIEPEPRPSEPQPVPTQPPQSPAQPDVKPTEWVPYEPREYRPTEAQQPTSVIVPPEIPAEELPKVPDQRPTPPYYSQEGTNESIPPESHEPEPSYIPSAATVRPSVTPPYVVDVNVGERTATIAGERHEDGSVVVDTKDVPKNKWTEISTKPNDCPFGFEPDEYGSCFDIDECVTNRHSCSGLTEICKNTLGGYTCNCAAGFRRDLVTKACDVITTSSTTTTTTTTTLPPPTSTIKSFWGYPVNHVTQRPFRPRNLCDAGFHYNSKTYKCEDIDECTNGQANCAAVEICTNTEGGYKCECPPNWRLDDIRHRCVPSSHYGHHIPPGYGNEPVFPTLPPKVHIPSELDTKYDPEITQIEDRGSVYRCPVGYRLGEDNTCIDVNECLTGEAKCGPQQICVNLPGGYSCNCPTGHRLIRDHECEDVDECTVAGNLPVCSQNADCVNTIGSYRCNCHAGFRSAPVNDKVCVDVDECVMARAGALCQHRCNNVWGGYRCTCHRGYRLMSDNSTCVDVDECSEFKSKVPCVGRCLNEPGSYRCACPKGYKLSEDKRSCIDIDECETSEAPCAQSLASTTSNDICINTRGGYKCHRITCPIGYRLQNKHRCSKVELVCQPGDWNCTRQPTTISYNFITFVSNLYIPDTELKLFTMKGPAWSNAKMRFELMLVKVNAPPSVKKKADINDFLLTQTTNFEGLMSLVRPLEGPQNIELDMTMDVYTDEHFGGTAVAKLFIYVSEYEF